jgi:nitroreductase
MSSEKTKVIMNPVIEAINNKQSIRSYMPKPIPKDVINTIIEAGNQAPSRGRDEPGALASIRAKKKEPIIKWI